jgi:hypothetical protein
MEMIISREKIPSRSNTVVVTTPLEAIVRLESATIARVVLADPVFAAFIVEAYPSVDVELEA